MRGITLAKAERAAGKSVDELVREAVAKVADPQTEHRLVATKTSDGLFPDSAAGKRAADESMKGDEPLFEQIREEKKGKATARFVRLTSMGAAKACESAAPVEAAERVKQWLPHLPPNLAVNLLKQCAARLNPAEAVQLLTASAPLLPAAEGELLNAALDEFVLRQEALATERRQEQEVRRRTAEAQKELLRRLAQIRRAEAEQREEEARELRQQAEWLGRFVNEPPPPPPVKESERERPEPPRPVRLLPRFEKVPASDGDFEFQQASAREFVEAWRQASDAGDENLQLYWDMVLTNLPGMERIGEVGEVVSFDSDRHISEAALSTGDRVQVVRPGWLLTAEKGPPLLLKAQVVPEHP